MRANAIHHGLLVAAAAAATGCDADRPAPGEPPGARGPDAAGADLDPDASGGDGCTTLFDGTHLSAAWTMSMITNQPGRDPGRFDLMDGALVATPGTDIGLLWYTEPLPADYMLELEWRQSADDDNSGVFVRFPHLDSRVGYDNTALVAVHFGFEVQIDGLGQPDGAPEHTTGAIYGEPEQSFSLIPALPVGEWNHYRIRVQRQSYTVELNGTRVTQFENPHAGRGVESPAFAGLQTHSGHVSFRAIRVCALDRT